MKLLIDRHGKTVWNEQKRTQGRVHNRLCKDGILSSQETAEKLKNIKIDYIFSSPLLRSVQTANIINKYHNKKIIKDERLTDIDQGVFTGRFFESLTNEELQIKQTKNKDYGMESLQEMYVRIKDFFEFLKKHYYNYTILIVTHSGVARMVELSAKFDSFSNENFNKTMAFQNSEIREIVI